MTYNERYDDVTVYDLTTISKVARFFNSEDKWCKGTLAMRKSKVEGEALLTVDPDDPEAERFCFVGAMQHIGDRGGLCHSGTPTALLAGRIYEFVMNSAPKPDTTMARIKSRFCYITDYYGTHTYAVTMYNDQYGYEAIKELIDEYLFYLLKIKWQRTLNDEFRPLLFSPQYFEKENQND
jgi:hypothetical protein